MFLAPFAVKVFLFVWEELLTAKIAKKTRQGR
jgi:hypothetical protein